MGREIAKEGKEAYERLMRGEYDKPKEQAPIINPIILPNKELSFIEDENLYKEIVKYLDKTFPAQKDNLSNKLKFENNVMKGSNSYIATAVDMYFKSINSQHRIARQFDLETNLPMFKGCYEDTGLALRSLENKNKSQAEYLFSQLKQRNSNIKFPIFINLRGLSLDSNLNFNLTDESQYKTAECLNWKNGEKYSKIDEFGLPKEKDENSSRQILTINSGLSSCYLNRGSNLYSDGLDLSYSNDLGRVVLAKEKK